MCIVDNDYIKNRLTKLFNTNPNIHIEIAEKNSQNEKKIVKAKIVGVYKHIFQIKKQGNNLLRYSIRYGEVVAGIVKIKEIPLIYPDEAYKYKK